MDSFFRSLVLVVVDLLVVVVTTRGQEPTNKPRETLQRGEIGLKQQRCWSECGENGERQQILKLKFIKSILAREQI